MELTICLRLSFWPPQSNILDTPLCSFHRIDCLLLSLYMCSVQQNYTFHELSQGNDDISCKCDLPLL